MSFLKPFAIRLDGIDFNGVASIDDDTIIRDHVVTIMNPDKEADIKSIGLMVGGLTEKMQQAQRRESQPSFSIIEVSNARPDRWKGVLKHTIQYLDMVHLDYLPCSRHPDYIRQTLEAELNQLESCKSVSHQTAEHANAALDDQLDSYMDDERLSKDPNIRQAFIELIEGILSGKQLREEMSLPNTNLRLDDSPDNSQLPPPETQL